MIRKARIVARLARGAYTPFLRPYWDEEEKNLVHEWLAGGTISRSPADLTQSLVRLLGEGTLVLRSSGSAALQGAIEALPLDAGLITLQLRKLPEILEERAVNASKWRTSLEPIHDRGFLFAPREDNIFLKMWISPRSEEGRTVVKYLQKALWARGVETEPLYVPLHMRPGFDRDRRARSLSVAERLWRDTYSLPVRPNLYPEHWRRIERAVEQTLGNLPPR